MTKEQLQEKLAQTEAKAKMLVERINALEQEKQQAWQEALMVNGEMRLLKQMLGEQKPEKT